MWRNLPPWKFLYLVPPFPAHPPTSARLVLSFLPQCNWSISFVSISVWWMGSSLPVCLVFLLYVLSWSYFRHGTEGANCNTWYKIKVIELRYGCCWLILSIQVVLPPLRLKQNQFYISRCCACQPNVLLSEDMSYNYRREVGKKTRSFPWEKRNFERK